MPSFFYHLALDLETAYPDTEECPKLWEAFQAVRRSITERAYARRSSDSRGRPNKEQGQGTFSPVVDSPENRQEQIHSTGHIGQESKLGLARDWRYGKLLCQALKMATLSKDTTKEALTEKPTILSDGISAGSGGLSTKGRYESSSSEEEEIGWGVIRLYRDGQETPRLYEEPTTAKGLKASKALSREEGTELPTFKDGDCTTLCILAVPSYLTPSDFLGFVGEKTREEVSHFRMIRTERSNRYMVLMKFRNGKKAREWRREWNGKAFDGMEVWLTL